MKWYPINKFRPPLGSVIIVSSQSGHMFMGEYTLDYSDIPTFYSDEGISISGITHFCIPDPVGIDDYTT